MTSELYEADLEKALILSKLEYEQHKQVNYPPTHLHTCILKGKFEGGYSCQTEYL